MDIILIVSLSLNALLAVGFAASWWTDRDVRLHRRLARDRARLREVSRRNSLEACWARENLSERIADAEMRLRQMGESLTRYEEDGR